MKKYTANFFIIFFPLTFSCSYETDKAEFLPQIANLRQEQRLRDVYPEKIQNYPRRLNRLLLPKGMHGSQAEYGYVVRLQVIEIKSAEFFEQFYLEILPKYLSRYQIRYQKKLLNYFHLEAEGKEGEVFLAFFDPPWLVTVEAAERQMLAEIMQKFPYFRNKS